MSDELDVLRSFRPEAAGPTETRVLQERSVFMDAITAEPSRSTRRRPRGRRQMILAVAATLAVAGGAAAGISRLVPDDVSRVLTEQTPATGGFAPLAAEAVQRASAPTADGGTVQVWSAPTGAGGTCAFVRYEDSGATGAGPVSCQVPLPGGTPDLDLGMDVTASGLLTVFGRVPSGTARVRIDRTAGEPVRVNPTADGWFVAHLGTADVADLRSVRALAPSGAQVGNAWPRP
jgi:hypothetical protein